MSIQVKLYNSNSKSFIADIETFPARVKIEPGVSDYTGQFILSLFFTLFGLVLFYNHVEQSAFHPNVLLALGFASYGGYNFAKLFKGTNGSGTLVFHPSHVEVEEVKWIGTKKWQAPYSEFEGIKARTAKPSKKKSLKPYQIIEMIHPEKQKNLPLYAKRDPGTPQNKLEEFARKLNMKILP